MADIIIMETEYDNELMDDKYIEPILLFVALQDLQ